MLETAAKHTKCKNARSTEHKTVRSGVCHVHQSTQTVGGLENESRRCAAPSARCGRNLLLSASEALARSARRRRARGTAAAKRLPRRTAVSAETSAARPHTHLHHPCGAAGHKFGRIAARTARPPAIRRRTALRATACARGERGLDAPTHTPRAPIHAMSGAEQQYRPNAGR